MSLWRSEPRLTPRGARLCAGLGLLLLACAFGPAAKPALVTSLLCVGLLITDGVAARRRARAVPATVAVSRRTFAGIAAPVTVDDTAADFGLRSVEAVLRGHAGALKAPVAADGAPRLLVPARGIHCVERWSARFHGPLGLLSVQASAVGPSTIVAVPQPTPETEARALGIVPVDGLAGRARSGPPHDPCPAGLRAWRSGDPIRAIHSRASARRGRPVVREDEPPTSTGVAIELDRAVSAADLEFALGALVRILLDAERTQLPIHIQSQETRLSIGPGLPHCIEDALRFAAGAQPTGFGLPPQGRADVVELAQLARLGGRA